MSPAELRALLEHELERAKSTLAYCRREVRAEERRVAAEAARYADAVTAACAVFGETVRHPSYDGGVRRGEYVARAVVFTIDEYARIDDLLAQMAGVR